MADQREVNLLPEKDRREADEAVKKATAKRQERDIKLVMPVMADEQPKQTKQPGLFKRMFAKKPKTMEQPAPSKAPSPAPAPAPVKAAASTDKQEAKHWWESKRSESKAPAMHEPAAAVSKPAALVTPSVMKEPKKEPKKMEPMLEALKAKPVPPAPAPRMAPPAPKPTPKKESSKGKMHEPQGDMSFGGPDVNLVPEYVKAEIGDRSWVLLVSIMVFVFAFWVIASGVAVARAKSAESKQSELHARLTQVNAAVKHYEEEKTAEQNLQKQFTFVETALNNHVYWTPFLQKLEETTIPDVYYVDMTADRNGSIRLKAVAKSYTSAARQIRAFERATSFVQKVDIHEAMLQPQPKSALPVPVVTFDIQLTLTPNALQIDVPMAAAETQTKP